jgi:fructosamine-3-kinase
MSLWTDIEKHLTDTLDRSIRLTRPDSVGGGCINQTFVVRSGDDRFFVKVNDAPGLAMFEAEALGLEDLGQTDALRIPKPYCWGVSENRAYLVMEDLSLGGRGDQAALGEGLAAMHRIQAQRFGWHRDNTIGSTPQVNTYEADWLTFWREHRMRFQLDLACRNGAGSRVRDTGDRLIDCLPALLAGHAPLPSLLHGDLWSGNYAFTRDGEPALFDPAVYYGDRETDLAMTELFGGFGRDFYAAYNDTWPLDAGYPVRKTLYNLYHILNHYNLFGGGYLSQAQGMMQRLVSEIY